MMVMVVVVEMSIERRMNIISVFGIYLMLISRIYFHSEVKTLPVD